MRLRKKIYLPTLIVLVIIFIYFTVWILRENIGVAQEITWGVTFSKRYAEELNTDWRKVFLDILDDLNVKAVRLPLYWQDIEKEDDKFVFDDYNWMVEEAQKRGVKIIIVLGRRVPRWPECHEPDWVKEKSLSKQKEETLELVSAEVINFRSFEAIVYWQVENEPLFPFFGICPEPDREHLKREIEVVRSLDPTRPIVVTDSGELSTWLPTATLSDILGISMYRVTWNKYIGYFYWPVTPEFYRRRARDTLPFVEKVIITELQAEPWSNRPINETPFDEQFQSMDIERFKNNIEFAKRVGFSEVYLWGAEWWWWAKSQGYPEFWQETKKLWQIANGK